MPDKPKIKRVNPDSRRFKVFVIEAVVPALNPGELEHLEKVIKRVKRERGEVQAVVK